MDAAFDAYNLERIRRCGQSVARPEVL